jgi:hypothetical protein
MEEDMCQVRLLTPVLLFLALPGCGDGIKRVPVEGKLTAKGTAVEGAFVQFVPAETTKGEGGIGLSDQDGKFSLSGAKGVKGVAPGAYKVRVSRLVMPDGKPLPYGATEADNPGCKESIPAPYSSPESPLRVTVPDAGGDVPIDIPVAIARPK